MELCMRGELQDALAIAALSLARCHRAALGEPQHKGRTS